MLTFGPAVFDENALTFNVAHLAQTAEEGGDELRKPSGRRVGEIADHRYCRLLLRVRRERPRSRAARRSNSSRFHLADSINAMHLKD